MGREIRRVIPNWDHPKYTQDDAPYQNRVGAYRPLYDRDYESEMAEWIKNHFLWLEGKHPDQQGKDRAEYKYFAQWEGGPPDIDYYRPKWNEGEATWWQVYETVSEGTPVSPPFATQDELIDYLAANGDFWDQQRGDPAWGRKAAENFVRGPGWAPSFAIVNGVMMSGVALAGMDRDGPEDS